VAAGVGVTPLRALLEDLPHSVDIAVMVRAPTHEEVIFHAEIAALVKARGGRLHVLTGSRQQVRIDSHLFRKLVPDIRRRDVYLCGPQGFTDDVVDAARTLGVSPDRIHMESFAF